jgi:hypothetical protein
MVPNLMKGTANLDSQVQRRTASIRDIVKGIANLAESVPQSRRVDSDRRTREKAAHPSCTRCSCPFGEQQASGTRLDPPSQRNPIDAPEWRFHQGSGRQVLQRLRLRDSGGWVAKDCFDEIKRAKRHLPFVRNPESKIFSKFDGTPRSAWAT